MANETQKKTTPSSPARSTADQAPAITGQAPPAAPAPDPVNPAGAAVADAVRQAEIRRLTEQRDELRKLVGDAPELDVLRAEVDALQQVAARAGVTRTTRWTMSAGVASDLEVQGYAVDPGTGDAYVRDGDRVTVTSRSGQTRTVDMPATPSDSGTDKK